jgi:hypothetical protein
MKERWKSDERAMKERWKSDERAIKERLKSTTGALRRAPPVNSLTYEINHNNNEAFRWLSHLIELTKMVVKVASNISAISLQVYNAWKPQNRVSIIKPLI